MSKTKVMHTRIAYSEPEELTNIISHALGAALSFVGLVFLMLKTVSHGYAAQGVVSVFLYGLAMLVVFAVSAIYHAMPYGAKSRAVMRKIDRCFVPIVIVGTFAPFALIGISNGSSADAVWGYALFAVVAAIALATVALNAVDAQRFKIFNLVGYVIMGWACVIRVHRIFALCGSACFWFLVGGGLAYSLGVVFYSFKKIPFGHAVWHMCALVGAALQFVSIYTFLL